MKAFCLVGTVIVPTILCLSIPLLAQRADRGLISGLVNDQTGSRVPGATVTARGTRICGALCSRRTGMPLLFLLLAYQ